MAAYEEVPSVQDLVRDMQAFLDDCADQHQVQHLSAHAVPALVAALQDTPAAMEGFFVLSENCDTHAWIMPVLPELAVRATAALGSGVYSSLSYFWGAMGYLAAGDVADVATLQEYVPAAMQVLDQDPGPDLSVLTNVVGFLSRLAYKVPLEEPIALECVRLMAARIPVEPRTWRIALSVLDFAGAVKTPAIQAALLPYALQAAAVASDNDGAVQLLWFADAEGRSYEDVAAEPCLATARQALDAVSVV
jgi:hypothetical protein